MYGVIQVRTYVIAKQEVGQVIAHFSNVHLFSLCLHEYNLIKTYFAHVHPACSALLFLALGSYSTWNGHQCKANDTVSIRTYVCVNNELEHVTGWATYIRAIHSEATTCTCTCFAKFGTDEVLFCPKYIDIFAGTFGFWLFGYVISANTDAPILGEEQDYIFWFFRVCYIANVVEFRVLIIDFRAWCKACVGHYFQWNP